MSTILNSDILWDIRDFSSKLYSFLNNILPDDGSTLVEAMRYSTLSGGKGLRSYMLSAIAMLDHKLDIQTIYYLSAVIEIIHCYSLIHDDLPSMDNDDMRRGKPSCHVKFDEATAILAGDSLLTLGFEVLSSSRVLLSSDCKLKIIYKLAHKIGYKGMAGGQMLDLLYENQNVSKDNIIDMLSKKTAFLFAAAAYTGAIAAGLPDRDIQAFEQYGYNIGLAFQIKDDILDVVGNENKVGKKLSKDDHKSNVVNKYGIEYAERECKELVKNAISYIEHIVDKDHRLVQLAHYVIDRDC